MPKVVPYFNEACQQIGWKYFCPGCRGIHAIDCVPFCNQQTHPRRCWHFDGNVDNPTISPSINSSAEYDSHENLVDADYTDWVTSPEGTRSRTILPQSKNKLIHVVHRCHSTVTKGIAAFCSDCTHAHKGEQLPLGDYPWPD